MDVIPVIFVRGNQFDLLQAATVRPTSGGVAKIQAMYAGFDLKFFGSLPSGDDGGGVELTRLLERVRIYKQADVVGVSDRSTATSGHVGVNLAVLGGSAHADAAEATRYSLTNVEIHSLEGSPLLRPFLVKHLPTFAMNILQISSIFQQEPTIFSGSIDKVVAIVISKLTGTVGIYSEKTQVTSGEMEVHAVDPTSGTSVAASANQSSSHKDQHNELSGIFGASLCLLHLHKSVSSGGVKALNSTVVKSVDDDPALTAFCRKIKFKEFRKLVARRNQASLGFLTEKESDMGSHESLERHLQAAQKTVAAYASLAAGGWDDNAGVVNLEIAGTNTVPVNDSARLREGEELRKHYEGSLNLIFLASRNDLSSMYKNLKNNIPVDVAGMRVKAMSPAFEVDTSDYLPICFLGKGDEEEDEIPGSVVRDFIGNFVFIFPVEGHETKRGCATVYSDWEVRESIVRVGADEQGKNRELKAAGFYEIVYEQGSDTRDGQIVMARHQLAREGDPFDGEPSDRDVDIFRARAPNDDSAVVAAASSVPTLMTSTAVDTEE